MPDSERVAHHITPTTEAEWRKVTEGLTRRFSGEFPYARTGAVLTWRTERERAAISIFALTPDVLNIEVIPDQVRVRVLDQWKNWTPALRLTLSPRRTVMIDVVRDETENLPDRWELVAALVCIYAKRGIFYKEITQSEVYREPRLSNARLILGYRAFDADPETEFAIISVLSNGEGRASLGFLESKLVAFPETRAAVFSMAAHGHLKLDLWARDFADMSVELLSWEGPK